MNKIKNKIKNTFIVIALFITLCIGLCAAYNRMDLFLNPPITEIPEFNSVLLNIDNSYNVPVTTFRFSDSKFVTTITSILDTGSAINTINEESYQLIKERGYIKKEYFCPLLLTDANKNTTISTRCVHIDIPVQLIPQIGLKHCIKNVRFFIRPGDDFMTLGVEFLKEFIIHSEAHGEQWRLSKELPEDYLAKFQLKKFNWHINDFGGRYYWPLTIVGSVHEDFFIDTGYGFSTLQMPMDNHKGENLAKVDSSYSANSVAVLENTYDTLTIKVGDFTFDTEACFFNGTRNTSYVINPHALREKFNISYDLKNGMLYIVKQLK